MSYGGKILAAMGAGCTISTYTTYPDYSAFAKYNPFLIFVGPSGNVCRLPDPLHMRNPYYDNGIEERSPSGWDGIGQLATNALSWGGNELLFYTDAYRGILAGTLEGGEIYAFCPYGVNRIEQPPSESHLPEATYNLPQKHYHFGLGASFHAAAFGVQPYTCVVQDGTYYKKVEKTFEQYYHQNASIINICNSAHLVHKLNASNLTDVGGSVTSPIYNRAYIWHTPLRYATNEECRAASESPDTAGSGYLSLVTGFGPQHHSRSVLYTADNYFGAYDYCKNFDCIRTDDSSILFQMQTMFFNGRLYLVTEDMIGVAIPAIPGGFGFKPILHESVRDTKTWGHNDKLAYVNHQPAPTTQAPYGAYYKCPIKFGNRLLFLQNDGKLLELVDGDVIERSDITEYLPANQYASGIYGGNIKFGYGTNVNNSYKCFGITIGNTLHVFLNYFIDANKCGIFWGTTTDLVEWTDNTNSLPSSGIIAPSGMTTNEYLGKIGTYQFSGYNNFDTVEPAYSGSPSGYPIGVTPCRPSGWTQSDSIDMEWQGSGTFYDCDYSLTPDNWDIPMSYGPRSRYLFPTWLKTPASFTVVGLQPSGIGFEGYDWTGVYNYHVHGYKDEIEEKVHLFFSEDVINHKGDTSKLITDRENVPSQVLYYTLDSNNNWTFMNQFKTKRLAWVEPTDMHEPSILMPSGSNQHTRYPYEDRIDKVVYQPIIIYDWPFFSKVNLEAQYSTNYGNTWNNATPHSTLSCALTNLDTGSLATDPSGIIGVQHMFAWDYISDVGNSRRDWVQFRFRAVK